MRTSAPTVAAVLSVAVAVLAPSGPASAQTVDDVVHVGERFGTRPPQAYFDLKATRPDAFTFSRAWKNRNPRLLRIGDGRSEERPTFEVREEEAGGGMEAAVLGPLASSVEGTFTVPVVLGYFDDDSSTPFTRQQMQEQFWDGPNARGGGTITDFYGEISGGRLNLVGETFDWVQSELTRAEVAGGVSGLGSGAQVGTWILELLNAHDDGSVDWGQFDNDGPDGVPNSGDDDGFVDVLAVIHPTHGGECSDPGRENRIWSHRFSLLGSTQQVYVTSSPSNAQGVGFVRVNDYTVQPARSCSGGHPINGIGVFAHELGHAFGLPDLYDTSGNDEGIGQWGLMGSGSWGCSFNGLADWPCHMSPWSKLQLGWVDPIVLDPDMDHGTLSIPPVVTSEVVYRVDAGDGSDEYYLLENRQRLGFDEDLIEPGLLIWHVDEGLVQARWPGNDVNAGVTMGVFLEQADGLDHLGRATGGNNRGDDGDPFPGSFDNRSFHTASLPSADTNEGGVSGLTVLGVQTDLGGDVSARVLTRFQEITIETVGANGTDGEVIVDGVSAPGPVVFESAPFQTHTIEAGAGSLVEPGVRERFQGWVDDPELPRTREVTTALDDVTLTAEYGGLEVRAGIELVGQASGQEPGEIVVAPAEAARVEDDGIWVAKDVTATFEAQARQGFAFTEWTGDLAGLSNPTTRTMDAPFEAEAVFDFIYEIPTGQSTQVEAAQPLSVQLQAVNGAAPITWRVVTGALPDGLELTESGEITGESLETGVFPLSVRATDAGGLEAFGEFTLDVIDPVISVTALVGPFLQDGNVPTATEMEFLDREGNHDGTYDLGDFRAFLLAHPDLPATVADRALVKALLPLVRFEGGSSR